MAHVERYAPGPDGKPRWRARWRTPEGDSRSAVKSTKREAERYAREQEHRKDTGAYVDPSAGRQRFGPFAEQWLAGQTFDPSTREAVESRLRVHILPTFKEMQLQAIRPSTVQVWLRGRQQECAPRFVRVMLANLSAILGAAVDDGLIARNPCAAKSVRAPAAEQTKIQPWSAEQVMAVIHALPERWQAIAVVAAGCGLRQGEAFGLRVEDVDFLRRRVLVRQQVKIVGSRTGLAPPKRGKTREVPLPDAVAVALAEHLRKFPSVDGLLFTTRERGLVNRNYFNHHIWKPSLRAAGVDPTRENGMHALRHFYASMQLEGGTSIRALADYLGHTDPGFTLRVYTHLMPSSEDRARQAVDDVFGVPESSYAAGEPAST